MRSFSTDRRGRARLVALALLAVAALAGPVVAARTSALLTDGELATVSFTTAPDFSAPSGPVTEPSGTASTRTSPSSETGGASRADAAPSPGPGSVPTPTPTPTTPAPGAVNR